MNSKKKLRQNDLDVDGKIKLGDINDVVKEVLRLLKDCYANYEFNALEQAFNDFEHLFCGRYRGFRACDMLYHDQQHSLAVTLAMARILTGHDGSAKELDRINAHRAELGLIIALFHDAGYIRKNDETEHRNGAEFTPIHVTRSGLFLAQYLPQVGLAEPVDIATEIVQFTGYERPLDTISVEDDKYRLVGHILGTADLMAQMADRCYPEKCRDRLYPEFVAGGMDRTRNKDGTIAILYRSGLDLIKKTPGFIQYTFSDRLDGVFGSVHEQMRNIFGGSHPYLTSIQQHTGHLEELIQRDEFDELRRQPPPNIGEDEFPGVNFYLKNK